MSKKKSTTANGFIDSQLKEDTQRAMKHYAPFQLCYARIRFTSDAAFLDPDVNNSGILGVEMEEGRIHVTLADQPPGRPLVLCPSAQCIYGKEYREFYLQLGLEAQGGEFVDLVAIHQ